MARPIKDNADYFTHDADMRDDPKIKALRRKFKAEGYGIWNMLLEAITDSDNFRLLINYEIISGDFDIEPDRLKEIINYCINLELLQYDKKTGFLWSKTLDKRFEPLLSKRKRDRFIVIADDNTQSKVKDSKGKKSRVKQFDKSEYFESIEKAFEEIRDNQIFIEQDCINILSGRGWRTVTPLEIIGLLKNFLNGKADIDKPKSEVRQHFKNWIGSSQTKLEDLQTRSQVFKASLNGATRPTT